MNLCDVNKVADDIKTAFGYIEDINDIVIYIKAHGGEGKNLVKESDCNTCIHKDVCSFRKEKISLPQTFIVVEIRCSEYKPGTTRNGALYSDPLFLAQEELRNARF